MKRGTGMLRRFVGTGLVVTLLLGASGAQARREPPPAVIPTAETQQAEQLYKAGRYQDAVAAAKEALTKNERYTPAMLVMAKSFFKLHKFEWMKKLWEMMQANGASNSEKAEIYQLLAFLEIDQKNVPGAIALLKQASEAKPDDAVIWSNLGAQYLAAKNYGEATPVLEKAASLQPGFAKAHLNLGDAYRGDKDYEKAQAEYQRALQLFPNYADAVFNLGILYLDADKIPNMDLFAKENTAIQYLQKYKQMMGTALAATDPADAYIAEAQDKIKKEEKRLERLKKQQERDAARAAKKAADDAKKAAAGQPADPNAPAPPPGAPGAVPAGPGGPASKAAPAGKDAPLPPSSDAPAGKAAPGAAPPAETPPPAAPAAPAGKRK
ncbi:MAG: tetratricopeptide repeat protein [Polyangia bacterium]